MIIELIFINFLQYMNAAYPRKYGRCNQLYHILAKLKTIPRRTIIELFTRNMFGDVTVEKVITDMYTSGNIPEIPSRY